MTATCQYCHATLLRHVRLATHYATCIVLAYCLVPASPFPGRSRISPAIDAIPLGTNGCGTTLITTSAAPRAQTTRPAQPAATHLPHLQGKCGSAPSSFSAR